MTFYKRSVIFLMAFILVVPFIFPKEKKVGRYLTDIEWYPRYPDQLNHILDSFFNVDTPVTAQLAKEKFFRRNKNLLQNEHSLEFSVSYASMMISERKSNSKEKHYVNCGPGKAPEENERTTLKTGDKPINLSIKEKKTLFSIARGTLEDHFAGKNTSSEAVGKKYNSNLTPLLKEKTGVFVTLKKGGELRGCIGTIVGYEPLWEGVCKNVLNAAFNDYRFPSLKENELKKIELEISVMTPLQKIENYKKIRLGTDGVIIKKYGRQAVFLPQVATETGWGLDMFLGQLCMKAGLPFDSYKAEGMEFFIFQALVFGEHDLKREK
jgi:AmmeMemoRadiSam system protein A